MDLAHINNGTNQVWGLCAYSLWIHASSTFSRALWEPIPLPGCVMIEGKDMNGQVLDDFMIMYSEVSTEEEISSVPLLVCML